LLQACKAEAFFWQVSIDSVIFMPWSAESTTVEEQEMKVGLLTGGGDCPGLNAVNRAVVRKGCFHYEDEFVGFLEGWRGLVENKSMPLDLASVGGILPRGGTILRTSRTNPAKKADGLDKCMATLKQHNIEALIAIGGDDTLSVAQKLHEKGVDVVGVPKTIDNDLAGTDFTFGFDTAVNIATEAIDRVHTTAEAHNRVMVVEVMGRDAGWIAMYSGIAGGADVILIPEMPFDIDKVAETIRLRHARGRYFSIVVVAEGAKFSTDVDPKHGAPIVVNIAGPHSFLVNRMADVEGDMNVRTRPLRHEVHLVPAPKGCDVEKDTYTTSDGDLGIYFRPDAGNHLLVGSEDPKSDDREWVDDPDGFRRCRLDAGLCRGAAA